MEAKPERASIDDGSTHRPGWWSRECGPRDVLTMAIPLIVSTASWGIMHFVDRMFLLWHDKDAMAASMPSGMLFFTLLCLPMGVAAYVNTFVAQYQGAGRPDRIGASVWQGMWIGAATGPLFLLAIPIAPWFYAAIGHRPELAALEATYFQVICFGAPAMLFSTALSTFYSGRGKTWPVMIVDSGASALNVLLDYLLIFGHWGFPEWGIAGAATATVISLWLKAGVYLALLLRPQYRARYGILSGLHIEWSLLKRVVWFGGPNGLTMALEVGAFSMFLLIVGRLPEPATAATVLAFNINGLAFVPMLGLGIAVSTLVGQQLGQNNAPLAARATWSAAVVAMTYMGVMAAAYVLAPDWFLVGHSVGADPAEFAALRDLVVVLLRFVAAFCLLDAFNAVFVAALKGAGDTRFVFWLNAIVSPFPVAAAWAGMTYFGGGLIWCWIVVTAWICLLGAIYLVRFLQGAWRSMRVIEPDALLDDAPPDAPDEAARPIHDEPTSHDRDEEAVEPYQGVA